MLAHVEALGLGHRPDPDDAGRHLSTCPMCQRPDALVIFEPDDYEPLRVWCRARCHDARLEQALARVPSEHRELVWRVIERHAHDPNPTQRSPARSKANSIRRHEP
jgi:hypothetical protein